MKRRLIFHLHFTLAAAVCLVTATAPLWAQEEGKRVALIIGNDAYTLAPLQNAVNDARAMDKALRGAGFKTKLLENASKDVIDDALGSLADSLGPDDTALFYYAGHAFQIENENFIVPVDFKPASGISQAKNRCVSLAQLFDQLNRTRAKARIMILDACRGNPLAEKYSLRAGLAQPVTAAGGTYVAFSTGPNEVAMDNPDGRNSWFTEALSDLISQPGEALEINDVFTRVRGRVQAETENRQTPWSQSSLGRRFYFRAPSQQDTDNDPTLVEKWMSDALLREQREDWTDAIELLNMVLKKANGPTQAAAKAKLPYLIARRDARASFEAGQYAQAAALYKQAFRIDPFAMDAAFEGATSFLLSDRLTEAIPLLQAIRVRGASASVGEADAVLRELASVSPEAAEEIKTAAPLPPPVEEVFSGITFGMPDWRAGMRYVQSTPAELGVWVREASAAIPTVIVAGRAAVPTAPGPAPAAASSAVATTAAPAVPASPPKIEQIAAPPITEHAFHLEVVTVGGTRELDYRDVEEPTPGRPKPERKPPTNEFGFVQIEGPVADTTVLIDGKPAEKTSTGKLRLAPGKYQIRAVRDGKIVYQQDAEVLPTKTITIVVQQ